IAYVFLYRGLFLATVQRPYEALKESESHYAATLDALPDMLFEVDRQGVYRAVHASKLDKLAAPAESIIGRSVDKMLPPEAARVCFEAIYEADRAGSSHGHRIKLEVPEGARYFELSIAKKRGQQPDADLFLVLSRDITTTVRNEERVIFEAKFNATLLELQERAETDQHAEFLQRSLELAQKLVESPIAFVYSIDEDQKSLNLLGGSLGFEDLHQVQSADTLTAATSIAASEMGLWADAILERRPIVSSDELSAADIKGLALSDRQPALKRFVSIPVMEADQVRLLLVVADKSKSYSGEEVNALQLFATTLWNMLKQNSKNLTINLLTEALEQSPHSVVITDTSAKIQYVNRAFCDVSGYSAQEVIGQNPSILQSGETPPLLYRELWARLKIGKSWQGEFVNRKKDGGIYVELVAVYPIFDRFGVLTHYVAHKVDVTESKSAEKRIRDLSDFDPLTGLLNKKSFYEKLTEAIGLADQRRELLSLLWFNLDNFKVINESLGHDAGDELLVEMASRLRESVSAQAIVARHSGDTFVVIIPRETQSVVAVLVADVLNKLKAPTQVAAQEVSVGASVGISVFPHDAKSAGTLASAAEIAMYRAKDEGRNSLRFFAPAMQQNTQRSLDLALSLSGAQERGELYLVYQPQLRLSDNKIVGAEVLLRWQHPKWGPVSPSEFIPIAEQTGLIVPIGQWVLEQVAYQLRDWASVELSELTIAVNVSAVQFVRTGFVAELIKIMSKARVSTSRLEIEITEAVALRNAEQAAAIIEQLHDAGFKIAVDDFGTGYSSLSYLRRYAIDTLKIDQSFVNELTSSESDQSIVAAIIKMAQSLKMTTIAEGVESAEQAGLLQTLGCDDLQGYWLSRPIPATEFVEFLQVKNKQ
ncbi:EAL domain-containing protein, partial [Zwartia sp.]|uniref:sensor domain-containing protein n=1 Tax=Zwartia sp. TaxID=2978004 RepID=UPI002727EF6A